MVLFCILSGYLLLNCVSLSYDPAKAACRAAAGDRNHHVQGSDTMTTAKQWLIDSMPGTPAETLEDIGVGIEDDEVALRAAAERLAAVAAAEETPVSDGAEGMLQAIKVVVTMARAVAE
jgi:hypothetical protein